MSAAQNPPPEIRNKNILKRRIGDRRFKIKKNNAAVEKYVS